MVRCPHRLHILISRLLTFSDPFREEWCIGDGMDETAFMGVEISTTVLVSKFRRKVFLHCLVGDGMDEAECNMNDLGSKFRRYAFLQWYTGNVMFC